MTTIDDDYTPGTWRHADFCLTPTGHPGDCWRENNRVLGIMPIPDGELPITIVMAIVCDDCGKVYAGPEYYTFPEEACRWTADDGATEIPHACTGNICPACAGPFITPDDENDTRRPTA